MSGPLVVQSDRTILLESAHPQAAEAAIAIAPFAQLARTPEYIHTYTITPLGLWNARASGHDAESVVDTLLEYAKYPVPHELLLDIVDIMDRFGVLVLTQSPIHGLVLESQDPVLLGELLGHPQLQGLLGARLDERSALVHPSERGELKHRLLKLGHPVADHAGYVDGEAHAIDLKGEGEGSDWHLRGYQREAVDAFLAGESGVVVMPCGAGKTVVGAAAMAELGTTTLILVTNSVSAKQWKAELLRRTNLSPDEIGEYSGAVKEIRPITIATYQVLTTRRKGSYLHLELLDARDWGLVVYDEVHLLPAPVFRLTAGLQARRRLGLTATLVREDGREEEVFSLIGPKQFDVPWKQIERDGYIAEAHCREVRVRLDSGSRAAYARAEGEDRYRLAATTDMKVPVVERLVHEHAGQQVLVIGQYLDQLEELGAALGAPVLTGKTGEAERERLYADFRAGRIRVLVVSKVANFSVDLPEASVAVQVSGSFGSRQEEAQRLGRILRPKADAKPAAFYTIVTAATVDEHFAGHRRRFLTEQGYAYTIENA
ncbi:DEAD/DEAH box helicase family protein [Brevibacterium sp. 5221]|uniref:DNA 3'-5' helicase n=1 Tax=Brevibacterium rongguiense TaxID=2695267 RepID=A0A6N9HA60_9MICO|nr:MULTISPECIES: DNA repair helicase XPB [Brevibacterium]MYM20875.1 DEAD/DEAH box helicase family protein [Brevibacterium rongguiense]WAL40042.1 helicase-associated domain-containing protein [Brevibacterium sp. BRM-1]